MAKAQISWNSSKNRYELIAKGKVLVASKKFGYLTYLVQGQKHSAIVKAGVTESEIISTAPTDLMVVVAPNNAPIDTPAFTINERFDFTRQLAKMVIEKKARSLIVGGEGGGSGCCSGNERCPNASPARLAAASMRAEMINGSAPSS